MTNFLVRRILKLMGRYKYKLFIFDKRGEGHEVFIDRGREFVKDGKEFFEIYTTGEVINPPESDKLLYPRSVIMVHLGQGNYAYTKITDLMGSPEKEKMVLAADKTWVAEALMQNKRDFDRKSLLDKLMPYMAVLILFIGAGIYFYILQQAQAEQLKTYAQMLGSTTEAMKQVAGVLAGGSGTPPA